MTARYLGYIEARIDANLGLPNPSDPALREFATGPQLSEVVAEAQANLDNGVAFARLPTARRLEMVEVVGLVGDRAVVHACPASNPIVVVRRSTGEVLRPDATPPELRVLLRREHGRWRVSDVDAWPDGSGRGGCRPRTTPPGR